MAASFGVVITPNLADTYIYIYIIYTYFVIPKFNDNGHNDNHNNEFYCFLLGKKQLHINMPSVRWVACHMVIVAAPCLPEREKSHRDPLVERSNRTGHGGRDPCEDVFPIWQNWHIFYDFRLGTTEEVETNPVQDMDLLKVMFTHLKFNIAPEKLPGPNRKGSSSNHHFSGASC